MFKKLWGNVLTAGEFVFDRVTGVVVKVAMSKRMWTAVLTTGLTVVNKKIGILDDSTMAELVALAVAGIIGDSLNPIGTAEKVNGTT